MVRQPNGKIARFSEVVDNFTDYDMTEQEAFGYCFELMGRVDAESKVCRADEPGRFEECLAIIQSVHGKREADRIRELLQ